MNAQPGRVLVVAGHDPSGAGVEADRAALADLELEPRIVVTAWTEQTSSALLALGARSVAEWRAEARAELDPALRALKFGLLPGRAHVRAAAELVAEARIGMPRELFAVVDPVLSSSSRGRFLDDEGAAEYVRTLLPAGVVLTPNLDELAELAGAEREALGVDLDARLAAARELLERGARALVVKGGHGAEDPVRDLVLEPGSPALWLAHPRVAGGKLRGSGCRFATRLAGRLAQGWSLARGAEEASEYVSGLVQRAARGG